MKICRSSFEDLAHCILRSSLADATVTSGTYGTAGRPGQAAAYVCTAPLWYTGAAAVQADIRRLRAALSGPDVAG
jgi:hypothetical protein